MPAPPDTTLRKGEFISFEEPLHELNLLGHLKNDKNNKLSEWAIWLAREYGDVKDAGDGAEETLARFFDLTLAYEPIKRCTDFDHLLRLLAPTR